MIIMNLNRKLEVLNICVYMINSKLFGEEIPKELVFSSLDEPKGLLSKLTYRKHTLEETINKLEKNINNLMCKIDNTYG